MKTKVRVIMDTNQCSLKSGDIGYIDGYCRGGNDVPYAVVVVGIKMDFIPLYALEVIIDK
jgi:hypothetical protein